MRIITTLSVQKNNVSLLFFIKSDTSTQNWEFRPPCFTLYFVMCTYVIRCFLQIALFLVYLQTYTRNMNAWQLTPWMSFCIQMHSWVDYLRGFISYHSFKHLFGYDIVIQYLCYLGLDQPIQDSGALILTESLPLVWNANQCHSVCAFLLEDNIKAVCFLCFRN